MSVFTPNLSNNFIKEVVIDKKGRKEPIVQVISIKKIYQKGNHSHSLYKVAINDGINTYTALIHSSLCKYIDDESLRNYNIIKLKKYTSKPYSGTVSLIILGFEIIDRSYSHVIGKPSQLLIENIDRNSVEYVKSKNEISTLPEVKSKTVHCNICDLNQYILRWSIIGRVIIKSPIKFIKTPKGQRKSFTFVIKDNTAEIEACLYDSEVDKYFHMIEINAVYKIENAIVIENKGKNSKIYNEYKIQFTKQTIIHEDVDDGKIGFLSYKFQSLNDVVAKKLDIVDFIGVIAKVHHIEHSDFHFQSVTKRVVELCDQSNLVIDLVLYDEYATNFSKDDEGKVLAGKNIAISKRRGLSFVCSPTTILDSNVINDEAKQLFEWWEKNKDKVGDMKSLSCLQSTTAPILTLQQVHDYFSPTKEDSFYFFSYVFVTEFISKRKMYYASCPNPECRSKGLYSLDEKTYVCDRCMQRIENPKFKYAFLLRVADDTGSVLASLLGNDILGELLTGYEINEWVKATKDESDKEVHKRLHESIYCCYKLQLRAKLDTFCCNPQVKVMILGGEKINYAEAAKYYANLIKLFY